MVARLATRIGKLEKACPPRRSGCGQCEDWRVLGDGDYTVEMQGGKKVYRCAACGQPTRCHIIVGVNLRDVL